MDITAIITARGGSKGIPRKNLRLLDGKPLIVHTIDSALSSCKISRCLVSTEDPEIKEVSQAAGAEVLDRPQYLATDEALSRDVIWNVLCELKTKKRLPELFMLLQPTSPLRNSFHIDSCIACFSEGAAACAVSVTDVGHHPFKMLKVTRGILEPVTCWEDLETPRQKLPQIYRPNGAMYLMASRMFLTHKTFFVPPVMPFIMSEQESVDIDDLSDLDLCESILKERKAQNAKNP